jgi:hypothetical protein
VHVPYYTASRQQLAAERWKSRQEAGPKGGQGADRSHNPTQKPTHDIESKPELRRDGSEDELEL